MADTPTWAPPEVAAPVAPWAPPEAGPGPSTSTSAGPDWKTLFSGVDQAETRMDFDQFSAMGKVARDTNNSPETRAQAVNQAYVKSRLKDISPEQIQQNWPAVRDAFANNALGVGGSGITDLMLYNHIGAMEKARQLYLTEEFTSGSPYKQMEMLGKVHHSHTGTPLESAAWPLINAWQKGNEPLRPLPSIGPLPNMPEMGMNNPALVGTVYNIVKPAIEGIESPLGIATLGTLPVLKAGGTLAKTAYYGITGLFTGLMVKSAVEGTVEKQEELKGKSTMEQAQILAPEISAALLAGLAPFHTIMDLKSAPERVAMADSLQGKTVAESVKVLRDMAAKEPDPVKNSALNEAAAKLTPLTQENLDLAAKEAVDEANKKMEQPAAPAKEPVAEPKAPTKAEIQELDGGSFVVTDAEGNLIDYATNEAEAQRIADGHNGPQETPPAAPDSLVLPAESKVTVMEMGGKRAVQIDIPGAGDRPEFSGSLEDAAKAGYGLPDGIDKLPEGKHTVGELRSTEGEVTANAAPAIGEKWIRGESERNTGGDKFFSISDDIAGDFGETRPITESERPKRTLKVDDKPALAEKIGYEGDSLAEPLDTPIEKRFDTLAKEYAKKQGYDSIRYQNGTFGEPELHVFKSEPVESANTGIAHRVSEARGSATERGTGISPEDSVEHGRGLLAKGESPAEAVAEHEKSGKISADAMALVRARGEELSKASNAAHDKFGPESPQYQKAWEAEKEWIRKIKPMQTEWHKIGQAQQGETEIDTGTFHGLRKAFNESTGKDFTPKQAEQAREVAGEVKAANEAVEAAKKKLGEVAGEEQKPNPKVKSISERIIDSLNKAADEASARIRARHAKGMLYSGLDPADVADHVTYGAAKIAKGSVEVAQWSAEMVKELGDYVKPHLEEIWNKANKFLDNHIEESTKPENREAVKRAIRNEPVSFGELKPGDKLTPEQVGVLWRRAKEMIESGDEFDDIRHKISDEFGIPLEDVTKGLASPKALRAITDEMYAKMAERRRVVNQAKVWLTNARYPGWLNFAKSVPSFFFNLATFGHGTVGMITHAGNQMFNPAAISEYWTNFGRQFKLLGWHDRGAYHERMMQDLVRDPLYIKARRAGLANDPFKYQDDYQNAGAVKFFKSIGLSGNRGFDALKLFRQDRFNQRWSALPQDLKAPEMAKLLADLGNHETGVTRSSFGSSSANWILFAPKLEASRWAFLIGDPAKASKTLINWPNESPEARQSAVNEIRQKATIAGVYIGALAINQGFLTASDSDEKVNFTNPRKGDWLSFKVAGHNVGIISPMIGSVRFLVNVLHDTTAKRSKFEEVQSSRFEEATKDSGQYLRGKLSPFAKFASDVATQSDFRGNTMPWSTDTIPTRERAQGIHKYGYGEYAAKNLTPIPAQEAVAEVWKSQGMSAAQIDDWMRALTVAGIVGGTGAKVTEDHGVKKK